MTHKPIDGAKYGVVKLGRRLDTVPGQNFRPVHKPHLIASAAAIAMLLPLAANAVDEAVARMCPPVSAVKVPSKNRESFAAE